MLTHSHICCRTLTGLLATLAAPAVAGLGAAAAHAQTSVVVVENTAGSGAVSVTAYAPGAAHPAPLIAGRPPGHAIHLRHVPRSRPEGRLPRRAHAGQAQMEIAMRAYKVLREGRSEFTGWRWPLPDAERPGEWVRTDGPIGLCVNGIHAASPEQLPQWLGTEIWEIELGGEVLREEAALVASQARLVRKLHAWDESMRRRFAEMCLRRAQEIAEGYPTGSGLVTKVEHTVSWAGAAPAGYFTAMLAGESATGVHSGRDYDTAFMGERTRQAQWLRHELQLVD
jgi:hypothetical protein